MDGKNRGRTALSCNLDTYWRGRHGALQNVGGNAIALVLCGRNTPFEKLGYFEMQIIYHNCPALLRIWRYLADVILTRCVQRSFSAPYFDEDDRIRRVGMRMQVSPALSLLLLINPLKTITPQSACSCRNAGFEAVLI